MKNMRMKGILLGVVLLGLLHVQSGQPSFTEYPYNPIFSPGTAYYPTVIFDPYHFGDMYAGGTPYYKMWYSTGAGIALAYSEDGITWVQYGNVSGLMASAHHAHVIYDRYGFGGTAIRYKMWFWDTSVSIYTLAALKYAQSSDGITWTWSSVTQDAVKPLVTGVSPDWNRGTYGPIDVFYNPAGASTLDDSSIWNNKYIMYYDGTTGGIEQAGLAYSVNGTHWKRYGDQPVLPVTPGAWDSSYAGFGTVINCNGYHFFYSGGQTAMHQGIGYAFSTDGITWQKAANPIFHVTDGVSWRTARCYTPSVLLETTGTTARFHMWFTGDNGSNRAIGYAVASITLPKQGVLITKNTERDIQQQMIPLAQVRVEQCCEKNEKTITSLLDSLGEQCLDVPAYTDALQYIEEARSYCAKSKALIASGNAVAGNYCALQACNLYAEAIRILEELKAETA
ncbi:MAG: hypothetical protein AYK18_03025 [Theionarchaea archaeon DG-70]|nr:MAG: hypothetical protein AYK18_03025 [Theionarchaea archaeon DG-70]